MERPKQKSKKEKPNKYVEKEKPQSFITDVKTLRENLKIKEILRTVKMNSSMRIKAPRGSKVMQNKDFNDNEDMFDDATSKEGQNPEPLSATNDVVLANQYDSCDLSDEANINDVEIINPNDEKFVDLEAEKCTIQKSKSLSEGLEEAGKSNDSTVVPDTEDDSNNLPTHHEITARARDRKLSLDQTLLSSRKGLSQSELDLNTIGKSPLERKSSFFRKKMDSFLKNTTEIFKRQSLGSKSYQSTRRDSTCSRMSISMQSLNENSSCNGEYAEEALDKYHEELQGSMSSLKSSATPVRSNSSLSVNQNDRRPDESEESLEGSRARLAGNMMLTDGSSASISSLNEGYMQDSLLNARAISMSSGLDTAHGQRKRKTSRSNRVTWVASESLTDYFRRIIQDEKTKEMQVCHSYQDFSTIPEYNQNGGKNDSKGRRLSYQRAVSGEDPSKYQDTSLRRRKIVENIEATSEIAQCLAKFTKNGVPTLIGFTIKKIPDDAYAYLLWAESDENLEKHFDWKTLSPTDEAKQAVLKEFLHTEADYIRHLINIVEVYIAAAHALQDANTLLNLDTSRLFLNIPDILNANMTFWELVMYPMVADAIKNKSIFNSDLMAPGFEKFNETFEPYETYVCLQSEAIDYLRYLSSNTEFKTYLNWCHNQKSSNRLQLADLLVKPMQRLTKYNIIIRRINTYTTSETSQSLLQKMESTVEAFVHGVNCAIRQKHEIEKMDELDRSIDSFDIDFKDEELDRYFHLLNEVNLRIPMLNCGPYMSRSIIYEGDLRYKDNIKEMDVHVFLLTDLILICKKLSKGHPYVYKMVRPKYLLDKVVRFSRFNNRYPPQDVSGLVHVLVDDHGVAYSAFALYETAKDPNPQQTIRNWDQRIREARLTYELSVWFYKHPANTLAEVEQDYITEEFKRSYPEEYQIERRARERVAAMLHPLKKRQPGEEVEPPKDPADEADGGQPSIRKILHRESTEGSYSYRKSRLSSFQQSTSSRSSRLSSFQQSTSAASHDEPPSILRFLYKAGSSVEHVIPPQNPDDVARSITVNVVGENDTEGPAPQPTAPVVVLEQPTPHHSGSGVRSASAGSDHNTLRVSQHTTHALVHSLPDLTIEQTYQHTNRLPPPAPIQMTASERLYRSHQELLQRNRLAAHSHHFLTPDHRGTSYPPPSPNRGSLKRGLAFSYSFKHPPLLKMAHVNSQFEQQVPVEQPIVSETSKVPEPTPSTSKEKVEQKKPMLGRTFGNRSKTSAKCQNPEECKETTEVSDEPDRANVCDDDDDKSRKSDKSTKSNKSGKFSAKSRNEKGKSSK